MVTVNEIKFYARVRVEANGCHTWMGALDSNGYGNFHMGGKTKKAHRVAWFFHYGEWPPAWPESGVVVDHICHNSSCVNVEHLRLLTYQANGARFREQRKSRAQKPKAMQHCACCIRFEYNDETHAYDKRDAAALLALLRQELGLTPPPDL